MHKIPVFHLVHELGKIGNFSLEHSKTPIFKNSVKTEKIGSTV